MQISKCFPIVCAVTLAISSTCVQAADSSAQIKAREALRQKMQELDAQQPATNQPPPEVTPAPAPAPKVAKPAPPVAKPAPAQPPPTVQTQPRLNNDPAQEALRKKMLELQRQEEEKQQATVQATAPTPPPAAVQAEKPAPAPKQKRKAARQQNAAPEMAESAPITRPRGAPPEDIERARAAMRSKMSDLDREAPLEMAQAPESKDKRHPYTPSFDPIAGPSSGLSPAKEQQLGQLLTRYQADEITPEQYHAERAKILAQP